MLFAFVYADKCTNLDKSPEAKDAVFVLSNQKKPVEGLFVQVGKGAFDWIYVGINGDYVAKLEGIDDNNYFVWTFLYGYGGKGLDSVTILDNGSKVKFGNKTSETNSPIVDEIANQIYNVSGLFLNYGNGAFDWVYSDVNGSYLAKLEGKDKTTGYFIWTFLMFGDIKAFDNFTVSSDRKYITF
jgi:hypothetical protein